MKVLHLLQSNRFSGAENVACQIISICKNEKIEFAYSSPDGQIKDALQERNIKFLPMKKACVSEYKRVIQEFSPDVIHAHDMGASFYAALVCGNIKLVSHIHNNSFNSRKLSAKAVAYIVAAIKASHIFWVSDSAYKEYRFRKIFERKSSVLYNIIDINSLYEKMQQDTNSYDYDVVYLGRLSYPKNPQRLMYVLSEVIKQLPNIKVAIIGTGDLEDETKKLCLQLNLCDNITFLGFKKNPYKILKNSKVMVMTSRWEGLPMCALEALALGVPIVSTPTDGLIAVVKNGENGYLSDADDEIVQRIVQILTTPELKCVLTENVIKSAKEFMNAEDYKKKLLSAYKGLD